MIIKNNYKKSIVCIQGEEADRNKKSYGLIIAIPKRYKNIKWDKLEKHTDSFTFSLIIKESKIFDSIICIKDLGESYVNLVMIPTGTKQPKVIIVDNIDNTKTKEWSKTLHYYHKNLNKSR